MYLSFSFYSLADALNLNTSIANGTAPAGTFVDGGTTGSTGGATPPYMSLLNKGSESGTAPKAYLNYIIFDRDFDFLNGGFVRMTDASREYGQDGAHEKLAAEFVITQPGYVYIYLSNDNTALGGSQVEVYFDDFKVSQVKSPVVQMEDYYPFGLTFNSYQRENSALNQYLYNKGSELQEELELNVYQTHYRFLDPTISRWWQIDPKASATYDMSVYSSMNNNPIRYNDPLGDIVEIEYRRWFLGKKRTVTYGEDGKLTQNGRAFGGKLKGYLGKAVSALNDIRNNGGQVGVNQLVNSNNVFTIRNSSQNGGKNQFVEDNRVASVLTRNTGLPSPGSGGTIYWGANNTTGGQDQSGSTTRPAYVGLAHEMGHAMASDRSMSDRRAASADPAFSAATLDDYNAMHFENIIRVNSGLPLRERYGTDSSGAAVVPILNPGTNVNSQTGFVYEKTVFPNIPSPLQASTP